MTATDDIGYMEMALDLARRGTGYTSPNPMVGAVVVRDGKVVGRGYHERVGGPHAEVNAINDAGAEARGATLYVTLEPCNHTGWTPPCTEKILEAGIRRVVSATADPNPTVTGGGHDRLRAAGVIVDTGVCEAEARTLNEAFVTWTRTGRPFVIVKWAATLDGRIATRTGDSKWITGEASRACVHQLRHAADAILVGAGTVRADNPHLTARLPDGGGRDPVRIILDPRLTVPADSRIFSIDSAAETIIVTHEGVSGDRIAAVERQGAAVIRSPGGRRRIELAPLMDRLGAMGITSLLIEGGGRVIGSALRDGIVDKVIVFHAPKILGGDDGVPPCAGPGPARMADSIHLTRVSVRRFDDDVMVEGYLRPPV